MRTNLLTLLMGLVLPASSMYAQGDDTILPVDVNVTVNGRPTGHFTVTLYRDNERVLQLQPSKFSGFKLALELGAHYSISVFKEGFHEKLISLDTALPEGVGSWEPYLCELQLRSLTDDPVDPFYIDFPSALVRWYGRKRGFDHSEHYTQDIQAAITPTRTDKNERMVSVDRSRSPHGLIVDGSGR